MGVRGGLKQAARHLQPVGVAAADDDCFAQMQAKFPAAAPGESPAELVALAAELEGSVAVMPPDLQELLDEGINPDAVAQCIQQVSPFSGAGPSGLRFSHLQDALRTTWGKHEFAFVVTWWLQVIMLDSARIPDSFWQLHSAAMLTPLIERQPDGTSKIRHIACGEVLERLSGKIYLRERSGFVADVLEPDGQYGVAVEAGAEKAALAGKVEYERGDWRVHPRRAQRVW